MNIDRKIPGARRANDMTLRECMARDFARVYLENHRVRPLGAPVVEIAQSAVALADEVIKALYPGEPGGGK